MSVFVLTWIGYDQLDVLQLYSENQLEASGRVVIGLVRIEQKVKTFSSIGFSDWHPYNILQHVKNTNKCLPKLKHHNNTNIDFRIMCRYFVIGLRVSYAPTNSPHPVINGCHISISYFPGSFYFYQISKQQ